MNENTLKIKTSDGVMGAFLALPKKSENCNAIIVLQEAFGVNGHIRNLCTQFAQEGYVAIAPELFHRQPGDLEFGYEDWEKIKPVFGSLTNAHMTVDMHATFDYLKKQTDQPIKNIFTIGYCMGGFASILAACTLPLKGAIAYYGGGMVHPRPGIGFTPIIDEFNNIHCPTLFVFGEEDKSIPQTDIKAIEEKLKSLGKEHTITVYPSAGHAFSNDDRPAGYNAEATSQAWKQTLQWLKVHA